MTKEEEVIQKEMNTLAQLLLKYHPGPFSDSEEFVDAFEDIYSRCRDCEQVFSSDITECNVCGDSFCIDCASDHANEETGLL